MRINKSNHNIWYRETSNKLKTPSIFETPPQHVDFNEVRDKLLLLLKLPTNGKIIEKK